jgi:hypothetical protein
MSDAKTRMTDADVGAFLDAVTPSRRGEDGRALDQLFREVTGFQPKLWTGDIVGYGVYDYTYKSGRSGTFLATGFAPRKAAMSIYIMPGYQDYSDLLVRLGKHRTGAACLYVNKLTDVDMGVLANLIRRGLADLGRLWPVRPT